MYKSHFLSLLIACLTTMKNLAITNSRLFTFLAKKSGLAFTFKGKYASYSRKERGIKTRALTYDIRGFYPDDGNNLYCSVINV